MLNQSLLVIQTTKRETVSGVCSLVSMFPFPYITFCVMADAMNVRRQTKIVVRTTHSIRFQFHFLKFDD